MAESGKNIVKKIPPKLKELKEKIKNIFEEEKEFEVKEGESALKRFVRQFTIDGKSGFGPREFLEAVKNLVLEILRKKHTNKTKINSQLRDEKKTCENWECG